MTVGLKSQPVHPLGRKARVLLTSVFGPYAVNDEYGSRTINPMELYQNQVTRVQGPFSLRMFHRSFGIMMIQENLDAACTILDFPTLERFKKELRENRYDAVGISAIMPNVGKVRKMCQLIRTHQPDAEIVVGGHIAGNQKLGSMIDCDHIVQGEGVRWFQRYLKLNDKAPIKHPMVLSGFGGRILGLDLPNRKGDTAAILIPSVGCPMGCNFCSTSAFFGGKGKAFHFYETGDELFRVMSEMEQKLSVQSFFVLDENFLLYRKRALRLLELMEEHGKSWAIYVFSSAKVIQSYTMEQLLRLGVGWIWMGLEGEECAYDKLKGTDTRALVRELQSNGISVLGSSIIGLENHRPETMDAVIDYAVSHETVFHQFMLYTPVTGTPLYNEMKQNGLIYPDNEFAFADSHGQYRFNYKHPFIKGGKEQDYLLKAFERDFAVNGPSLMRLVRVLLNGWQRHKHESGPVKERFARDVSPLRHTYAGVVWAVRKWYAQDERMAAKADALLQDIYREFGFFTRAAAPVIGLWVHLSLRREARRLAQGLMVEPQCFCEKNKAAKALSKLRLDKHKAENAQLEPCSLVSTLAASSNSVMAVVPNREKETTG